MVRLYKFEIKATLLVLACSVLAATLPFVWAGLLVFVLIVLGLLDHRSMISTFHKETEFETIEHIVQRLPTSLKIGAHTHEEVFNRVIQLWEDSLHKGAILENVLEGVLLVSPEGHSEYYNQRLMEILGEEQSNVFDWKALKVPRKTLRKALKGQVTENRWSSGKRPNRRYFEAVGIPLEFGALMVVRDITKLRNLERMRRDFVANISHELRTPITTIQMNIEALLDLELEADRFVNAIHRNSKRLSLLVNGLLDLSRIESGEMELSLQSYRLKPIVQQVLAALETNIINKQHKLQVDVSDDIRAVVDAQALEQVLTNLISNAIKYSPIETTIQVRAHFQDPEVIIEVEDNGLGISPKHRTRLFERFYRVDKGRSRDEGGTGLGLAIVRHLTEAMGGEVGVRSVEPNGSIFWIRFGID